MDDYLIMIVIHPGYRKQKSILILIEWVYNLIAFILIMQSDTILTSILISNGKKVYCACFFYKYCQALSLSKTPRKNDRKKTSIIFQF